MDRGFWAIVVVAIGCTLAQGVFAQSDGGIPRRPEKLKFPPLEYQPPQAADYRVALKSGPVAYIVPNRELPLVNIVVYAHVGTYLEPAGKEGVAELTGNLLTHAGTKSKSAEELEERLAFLAAQLDSSVGDTQGSVSLNLLSKDLDEGLGILREVLTAPRFQDDRVALRKEQALQAMKQRNDDSEAIEGREAGFLASGEKFWVNDYATGASLESITRADLEDFHRKWFHPDNFVVAVSGDFNRDEMKAKLEKLFADWPFAGEKPTPIPTNTAFAAPGMYIVDKDVNQGRVSIMLPGVLRSNPDYLDVLVMNDILGGGGFTSRIMNSVRTEEGLAYSAYSSFPGGVYYPLTFTAAYQSKSRTVTYAASIVLKEIKKMTEDQPTEKELNTSKRGWIDRFPHNFATKTQVANVLAQEEFSGRYASDPEFWKNFRERIRAVTKEDVARVAKKYLHPENAVILIVGKKEEITMKLPDHPVTLQDLTSGPVTDVPLRDPLTMKPMTK
jgi:predicted Zn-dependent peptidase